MATLAAPGISATARSRADVTDHDLVQAVRAGDDHAFERLYHRYHRRIAAYVFGMVHDHGRAEDLTQEVFVSALRRMRQTDRPIAFKPWIYEIAKNASIDAFRRSKRAEEISFDAEEGLGTSDYGKLAATTPSPDAAVANKQSLDHLCGAFGGLSDAHHQILVMRELEGLSYREIGERLGMSRPSVESTLFRARRRLTEEYQELVTGERCLRIQEMITAAAGRGALGLRDQRRVGSHISSCQPCRKHAVIAGLDAATIARRPARARIAAFLPLPAFLRRRWLPGGGADAAAAQAAQHGPSLAQMSMAAAQYGEPTMAGWMKATAVVAAVAVAGVGAGAADHAPATSRQHDAPVVQRSLRAGAGGGSGPATVGRTLASATGAVTAHHVTARAAGAGETVPARPPVDRDAGPAAGREATPETGAGATPASGAAGGGSGVVDGAASQVAGVVGSATRPTGAAVGGGAPAATGGAVGAVGQTVTGTTSTAGGAAGGAAPGAGAPPLVQPDLPAVTQAPVDASPPSSVGDVVKGSTGVVGSVTGGQVGGTVKGTGQATGTGIDDVTGAVGGLLGGK